MYFCCRDILTEKVYFVFSSFDKAPFRYQRKSVTVIKKSCGEALLSPHDFCVLVIIRAPSGALGLFDKGEDFLYLVSHFFFGLRFNARLMSATYVVARAHNYI